jgi:hypothetical protein
MHVAARQQGLRLVRDNRDLLLVGLALLHGVLLVLWPGMILIALGIWWNSNTISHYFIHRPCFFF